MVFTKFQNFNEFIIEEENRGECLMNRLIYIMNSFRDNSKYVAVYWYMNK